MSSLKNSPELEYARNPENVNHTIQNYRNHA